jgi:hypothetical protein
MITVTDVDAVLAQAVIIAIHEDDKCIKQLSYQPSSRCYTTCIVSKENMQVHYIHQNYVYLAVNDFNKEFDNGVIPQRPDAGD